MAPSPVTLADRGPGVRHDRGTLRRRRDFALSTLGVRRFVTGLDQAASPEDDPLADRRHILVADADPDARREIAASLATLRLDASAVEDGPSALAYAEREKPDLVVLDLALPGISGLGLCRLLREDPALGHIGIVMVTAYAAEVDRILAFETGVDDFLPKPFYGRELASRVSAVLRRSTPQAGVTGVYEPPAPGLVTLQPAANAVVVGDRRLDLTPREFQLLATLIHHAGRVLTRQQLIARAWSGGAGGHTDRLVDAHVKAIRRKLGEAKGCVETVRGVGYRFSDAPRD